MKKFTNQKGITLIALIVTIIVMLILVGVTINVAIQSGLFEKAHEASKETQKQADREALYAAILDAYDYGTGTVNISKLQEQLGPDWTMDGTSFPYTFTNTKTNNSFSVYENGTIVDIEIFVNDFEIELDLQSRTPESATILVYMDISGLIEPVTFADDTEAWHYIYDMAGEEDYSTDPTEVIATLMDEDYDDIVEKIETQYEITNPSPETVLKTLIVWEEYENYTFKQAVEMLASMMNEYEPEEKSILVNGIPVASIDWNLDPMNSKATFETTVFGNLEIEVHLDNYKAKGNIIVDPVGDFEYTYDENTKTATVAYLTSFGTDKINSTGEITIPQTTMHNGEEYTVTAIGGQVFFSKDDLTSVNMPNSITSIGYGAFHDCTNLELTSLPSGVTSIGDYAFYQCTKLELTSLPSGATSIGEYAFSGCTNLALTSLPSDLTNIGDSTFAGCTNLALTSLPSSLTSIGDGAFSGCPRLDLTSLPSGVTSIGNMAFQACTSLALTSLPSGLTSIGMHAFADCTNLALTSLPSSLTSIGDYAFYDCANLVKIEVPYSVTTMGASVLHACSNLANIYIVGRSSKPDGWDSIWQGDTGANVTGGTQVHWNTSMPQN